MITKSNDHFPEIEWERCDLNDDHGHDKEYGAKGESKDGRLWGGTWYECDGQFVEIVNIEEE